MLAKTVKYVDIRVNKYSKRLTRTNVLGINQQDMTSSKWFYNLTVQCVIAFLINHLFMILSLLLVQNNAVFTLSRAS